jgi:hypothetical protein
MSLSIRHVFADQDQSSFALSCRCVPYNAMCHRTLGGFQSLFASGGEAKYPSFASNPTAVF